MRLSSLLLTLICCAAPAMIAQAQDATSPVASPPTASLNEADPLGDLSRKAARAADELSAVQTGASVQQRQKAIVDELDLLIERLRKKQRGCGSG